MGTKFINALVNFFAKSVFSKKSGATFINGALIFLIVISPMLILGYLNYVQADKYLLALTLSQRQSMAKLASVEIKSRLDRLKNIGVNIGGDDQVIKLIQNKKWAEAIDLIYRLAAPNSNSIDRVFLSDINGIEMADFPKSPNVIGRSFASRDWYKGVSKNWEPYVSEAYYRAETPRYNIFAIAVPVKDENQNPLAIIVIQIRLDTIFEWSKNISVGEDSYAFFVDQYGHLIAHPKYPIQNDIIDFSNVPSVKNILSGKEGIEVNYNPIDQKEELSAYQLVQGYGWGVVIEQPTLFAFASRAERLNQIIMVTITTTLFSGLLACLILMIMKTLIETRQKEKIMLESIGDGVVAIDRDWMIVLWNQSATEITGWSENEALGQPFRQIVKLIRESDRIEDIAFIENAIVSGKTTTMPSRTLLIKKDGSEIPVGDSAAPIMNSDNQAAGAIIVFRDATPEKQARMMSSDFAYASHQLRTPVTTALWNLNTAMITINPIKQKEYLEIAYRGVESVSKLSVELIEVSEIDQNMIIPDRQIIKLSDVFDEVVKSLSKKSVEKKVSIETPPISATAGIKTDKKLLKRIIEEILDNGIIYNKPDGKIEIAVSFPPSGGALIEFKDYGLGISKEQHPLIFTKFFRGSNRPKEIPGAGLGLYIAKRYTELLGGKIWFRSEENVGTTFYVDLPIQ